jgi:hypothetical protein
MLLRRRPAAPRRAFATSSTSRGSRTSVTIRQPGLLRGQGQQLEAGLAEPLEGVRTRAGAWNAPPRRQVGAGSGDRTRAREELLLALDRAGARDHDEATRPEVSVRDCEGRAIVTVRDSFGLLFSRRTQGVRREKKVRNSSSGPETVNSNRARECADTGAGSGRGACAWLRFLDPGRGTRCYGVEDVTRPSPEEQRRLARPGRGSNRRGAPRAPVRSASRAAGPRRARSAVGEPLPREGRGVDATLDKIFSDVLDRARRPSTIRASSPMSRARGRSSGLSASGSRPASNPFVGTWLGGAAFAQLEVVTAPLARGAARCPGSRGGLHERRLAREPCPRSRPRGPRSACSRTRPSTRRSRPTTRSR